MKYFTTGNKACSLRELRKNLKFIRSEEGTHIHDHEEDAILEFELFLFSLEKKAIISELKISFNSSQLLTKYPSLDLQNQSRFVLLTRIFFLKCQLMDLL